MKHDLSFISTEGAKVGAVVALPDAVNDLDGYRVVAKRRVPGEPRLYRLYVRRIRHEASTDREN